ncbi:hypothetical protein GCM10020000_37030 [Streptomyces olivoverticillatus]
MATLCRPAIAVPEYVITREQTLELARTLHADHPQLELALRLIGNTGVQTRHLVQPIEDTLKHPGFTVRNARYEREAKARVPDVVRRALENAEVSAQDIDMIVYVSCTGFMMPSMTAWLINTMDFKAETRQLPIAQLGCAAGGAAINRAHDFCTAYPTANVLIVACEFCSLLYQPTDLGGGQSALQRALRGRPGGGRGARGGRARRADRAERLAPGARHRGVDLVRGAGHRLPLHPRQAGAGHDGHARPGHARHGAAVRLGRLRARLLHRARRRTAHPGRPRALPGAVPRNVPLQPGDAHGAGQHRQRGHLRRARPALRGRGVPTTRRAA